MLWWTLQNLVVTAALAAAVWLACRALRLGPVTRHALWLVVMLKLLTPPLVFWPWAVRLPLPTEPAARRVTVAKVIAPAFQRESDRVPVASETPIIEFPPVNLESFASQPSSAPQVIRPRSIEKPPASRPLKIASSWRTLAWPLAIGLWIAGAAIFAAIQLARIVQMLSRLRRSAPADVQLSRRVLELSRRTGVSPVQVRRVCWVGSPLIWSLVRPVLVWPAEISPQLSDDSIAGLIVHELAHVKRKDHWVGWLELLAGCVWWWNPLYWYVRHQLRENAELACDGWVVQLLPRGRRAYGEALLAVCELLSRRSAPMPAVGISTGGRRFLERRLTMMLQEKYPIRLSGWAALAIGLLALAAVPAWSQKLRDSSNRLLVVEQQLERPTPAPADLPPDAAEILQQFSQQQADIRRETEDRIAKSRELVLTHLKALQDQHAKAGELDEAVAIRDQIRRLQTKNSTPLQSYDPAHTRALTGPVVLADPGNLVGYRDRVGQSFLFDVVGLAEGSVWGTRVYTDDSTLGAAAVHAGILQVGQRGVVRVTILPGLNHYDGVARNGITSNPYEKWDGSYIVQRPQGEPRSSGAGLEKLTTQILRANVGGVLNVEVVGSTTGSVWGSDVYTDDSSIAAAAVHAGLLKNGERGTIRIMPLPGQGSYEPSTRNGVTSQSWRDWAGSFHLSSLPNGSTVYPEYEAPVQQEPAVDDDARLRL